MSLLLIYSLYRVFSLSHAYTFPSFSKPIVLFPSNHPLSSLQFTPSLILFFLFLQLSLSAFLSLSPPHLSHWLPLSLSYVITSSLSFISFAFSLCIRNLSSSVSVPSLSLFSSLSLPLFYSFLSLFSYHFLLYIFILTSLSLSLSISSLPLSLSPALHAPLYHCLPLSLCMCCVPTVKPPPTTSVGLLLPPPPTSCAHAPSEDFFKLVVSTRFAFCPLLWPPKNNSISCFFF